MELWATPKEAKMKRAEKKWWENQMEMHAHLIKLQTFSTTWPTLWVYVTPHFQMDWISYRLSVEASS